TIDRHRWHLRMQGKIDQQRRPTFPPQNSVKLNDPTLPRNQLMARLLAQIFENRIEQRVFEFLRDDCALQIEKTAGQAKPFEIAVAKTGDHDAALRTVTLRLFEALQLDVLRKIFRRQARAP